MTRLELIRLLLTQAKQNGFQFKRWYTGTLGLPWQSAQHAAEMLADQRRYYALLFSHEFACCFWKAGEVITFTVERQVFQRVMRDGSVRTVQRKPYTRRVGRPDAWKFHLRQMALAEEPLRYMKRYLMVSEDLPDELTPAAELAEPPRRKATLPARALSA